MKKHIKKEWIENLRSGKYQQTTKPVLRFGNRFCVTGVLLDMFINSHLNKSVKWIGDGYIWGISQINYWVVPHIINNRYGYELYYFKWSEVKEVLGCDYDLIKNLTRRQVLKKNKKSTDKDAYEWVGKYDDNSMLNIIIMNHDNFSFLDLAAIIEKLFPEEIG